MMYAQSSSVFRGLYDVGILSSTEQCFSLLAAVRREPVFYDLDSPVSVSIHDLVFRTDPGQ